MRRLSIIMPDISSARHRPTADSERINRATERVAAGDNAFVDRAVGQLEGLQFPEEAVNPREERGDYPEVTPTAMSNYVCNRCGKPFQNQHDLVQHQKFESGASRDVKIPGNKNI
jgi:hypothetical protein